MTTPSATAPVNTCPNRNDRGHTGCSTCDQWAAARLRHRWRQNTCPDKYDRGHTGCPTCDTAAGTAPRT